MSSTPPSSASHRSSIPRPPGTSSPLRPTSPPTPTAANAGTRVQSHSIARVNSPSNSQSPSAIRRASSGTLTHSQTNSSVSSVTSPVSPQPRSKARDLLRKHYGLGVGPPPPTGKLHDPMDLDSQSFDAKAYYEQLITTSSLSTLLKRENELLSEIRSLDSDRQSLVYNHHHELIAASDTIAAMKSRAENLDAEMDSLKAAFSEISRLSTEVANNRDV